jgi:hypothetical protein
MLRSRLISGMKNLGKKGVGFLLLFAFSIPAVGFSFPGHFQASAASWLDQVFGDFKPRIRYRKTSTNSRSTLARGRSALGIGRLDKVRSMTGKKRRIYRIPKTGNRGYVSGRRTYRTMCVRTCDGYFFPVSFATTKGHLKKDASVCKSSCGVPASLYYYPNPGGDTKDMISYQGQKKYQDLKNAFLFRKKFVADCRCQPDPWSKAAKDLHRQYARNEAKRSWQIALQKRRINKKRLSKRRIKSLRSARKYSLLAKKKRSRYLRTMGVKRPVHRNKSIRVYRVRRGRNVRR